MGLAIALLLLTIYVGVTANEPFPMFDSVFIVYRMMGMAVFLVWAW